MDKSIYTREYALFIRLLQELRKDALLTQNDVADALKQSQSFVSKYERGDRRLDIIQLRKICEVLGLSLSEFVDRLEQRIRNAK